MTPVQPIDRNSLKYFIQFNNEFGDKIEIDEPQDFKLDINLKQNKDYHGRFITFGEDTEIIFLARCFNLGHQFDELIRYNKKYAWHSDVDFFLYIDDELLVKGKLNFENPNTDNNNFFKTKLIINNRYKEIESRKDTEIDLNSNLAIDEKTIITPINTVDLLTRFKSIISKTLVKSTETDDDYPKFYRLGDYYNIYLNTFYINPFSYIVYEKDIKIISNPLGTNTASTSVFFGYSNYTYIEFKDEISELSINIDNLIVAPNMRSEYFTYLRLSRFIQTNDLSNNYISREETVLVEQTNYTDLVANNITDTISINATGVIKRVYYVVYMYSAIGSQIEDNDGITLKSNGEIKIDLENIFEDSITKATKFIDVGEQIIKSNTNNLIPNLDAPRFKSLFSERNINLFDLYATSGLYIRGFDNQKYIAKWKDWLETLRNAFNFDYQLYNDTIFIGHYIDFYQDIEIASFEFQIDTDSYEINTNEKIKKSNIRLEYEKYEDDESNTFDSIHTESNNVVLNSLLENSENDLTIPYIADAYKIEYTRRESFTKDVSKSTPNDNDLYMIDTFYGNGTLTNRTNEGFDVSNLYSPSTSYNLKLSQKRILIDYFTERLAEISQYSYNTPKLKNVFYKNNSSATIEPTMYTYCRNVKTVEGSNITSIDLLNPIITGKIYYFKLAKRMKFNEYMKLIDDIMNIKGYITINGHENTIKLFVQELKYDWTNELLTIKGEEKHEQL